MAKVFENGHTEQDNPPACDPSGPKCRIAEYSLHSSHLLKLGASRGHGARL